MLRRAWHDLLDAWAGARWRPLAAAREHFLGLLGDLLQHLPPLNEGILIRTGVCHVRWLGRLTASEQTIARVVADVYERVLNQMRADFPMLRPRGRRIWLVCGSSDAIQGVLREMGLFRHELVAGIYVSGLGTAFVGGNPLTRAFRRDLGHELCHCLCDRLLRSPLDQAWACEGYAAFVARNAAGEARRDWTTRTGMAPAGSLLINLRALLRSPELAVADFGEAELVVEFLHSRKHVIPAAWTLVERALRGDIEPADAVEAFEQVFEMDLEDLAEEVRCFAFGARRGKD